ncbi:MAG: aldehyde dehydrogenase family protein [Phycisphaeraceae bacterium]|nr:aldehyde dehydrogenase family protein [Phycisphaeraceae bacterium]
MTDRLGVLKTYKLFIGGKFPRTESGRSLPVTDGDGRPLAHVCHASRKDLRDAVEAARAALPSWTAATAYNRGQILYRLAEMLESRRDEFQNLLKGTSNPTLSPDTEVACSIDRLVAFAGWADKHAQVLGCNNPVSGPYYNFTSPEPVGVVAAIASDDAPLLSLISLVAPALCAGNTIVAIGAESNMPVASALGEVCATSDVPAGVINILTGLRSELTPPIASHRDIDAVHASGLPAAAAESLRAGTAENLKRVQIRSLHGDAWLDADACESPWWIEPFVEMKTIWHPSGT